MRRKLGRMEMAEAITNEVYAFNAAVILHIGGRPAEDTLRKALEYLQQRHPLLGVHIEEKKKYYLFESKGTPAIPLAVVKRRDGNHWRQALEDELNGKFDLFTGPLARVVYLAGSGEKKESDIIITFQHSVVDAVSGTNLAHELLSFCRRVDTNDANELREGLDERDILEPLPPVEAFFPAPFQGLRRKWNVFWFMLRQMGDEIRFQFRSRGKRKPPIHAAGNCRILPMMLSKELTTSLSRYSRKRRVTLNNLLTAALLMAVQKHLYGGSALPLRHVNTADLRPYLIPPMDASYLGTYFAMMRYTVGMKENPGIWELTRKLNDLTHDSLKRGDKFCANLLSYRMMRMLFRFKKFRMCATALSFTGSFRLEKQYGKIEVRDIHAFPSNFVLGPEYSAVVRVYDGQIYWDILYLDSDMDQTQAGVIADEIRTLLESAVEEVS
ncbi:MAG: hypothetical protein GY950_25315 [bacterium]|nr:hypothetical protein [bacterium]